MTITLGGQPLLLRNNDITKAPKPTGYDPAPAAETAWLQVLVGASETRLTEWALLDVFVSLENGRMWFDTHDGTDPLYPVARQRRIELWEQERTYLNMLWAHNRATWVSCCDLFFALQLLPYAVAWMESHPLELVFDDLGSDVALTMKRVPDHPAEIWTWVMGNRPAPGEWPPADGELGYERVRQLETWNVAFLQEMLQAIRQGRKVGE